MALVDDISISVAGDIRETGGATNYVVLELHRTLQALADDQEASGNDLVDITSPNPSTRFTDQIIQLNNGYNIDDTLSERFYGGSIEQNNGDELYSGLRILGAVNLTTTQLEVVQDNAVFTSFWGTQASPFNGGGNVLARFLIKSRQFGCDIDKKKIRVQSREFGDNYDFFNVTLGFGEAVAAISTTNDPQNDTAEGTVGAYSHVTNTEGYQLIDIGDGNGDQPYYSQWTYGADTSGDQLKAVWEYTKYITRQGTSETIHSMSGALFQGITHSFDYDNESGNFTEDEEVVWGTTVVYSSLSGGTFDVGAYVVFGGGAAGRIMYDNGTTTMVVALEDDAVAIATSESITEYDIGTGASGVTATTNGAPTNEIGGSGILLALDDGGTTGTMHIQLITGDAPVNNQEVRGLTSTQTADVDTTITTRTVPKHFLGSYVGTLIGAYGIGIDPGDLTASDTVEDLDGDTNTPPNNVTFTVFSVVVGDRILVTNDDTGLDYDQLTLNTTLSGATETAVVVSATIPSDTPSSGTIRVQLDNGVYKYQTYSSYTSATFTIPSTDYSTVNATAPRNVFVSYLDLAATGTSEAFTTVFSAPRTLFVRVRDGGGTPIVPFETTGTLGSAGGSATAIRNSDA